VWFVTNYIKGRAFEYKIKDFFERNNYLVFRMAGSHGVFDLIAIKGNEIKLIQAKEVSNKSAVNHIVNEVQNELVNLKDYFNALGDIVVFVYLYLKVDRDKIYVYRLFNDKLREIGYYDLNAFDNYKPIESENKLENVVL